MTCSALLLKTKLYIIFDLLRDVQKLLIRGHPHITCTLGREAVKWWRLLTLQTLENYIVPQLNFAVKKITGNL